MSDGLRGGKGEAVSKLRSGNPVRNREAQAINRMIGQTLRKMRKQRHISLEEIADHLGVSYQQISKYERDHDMIPAARLIQIELYINARSDGI
jgi:predicted transcriptional regulator